MTKKFYHALVVMALCQFAIILTPLQLQAFIGETFTKDQLKYTVTSEYKTAKAGTVSVQAETKDISGDIVIPKTVKNNEYTYSVTILPDSSFQQCHNLKSITIPDSVTKIGSYAFYDCYSLTSITLSAGMTSIENYAFNNCASLTSITIPNSVTFIGAAFSDCYSLHSVYFKGNAPTLCNNYIFNGLGGIDLYYLEGTTGWTNWWVSNTQIVKCKGWIIQDGVIYVYKSDGTSVVSGYVGDLNEAIIPKTISVDSKDYSVTSIERRAFVQCSSLECVAVPSGVTSIGEWTFSECYNLKAITIPDSVTSIGEWAFSECCNLKAITIPDSVASIGRGVFSGCSSLTSVTIPDGVIEIGNEAFYYCSSLISIVIPNSVTFIGEWAFSYCYNLKTITIPDSVTSIANGVFEECRSLTSVVIPNSVTSIGEGAFSECNPRAVYFKGAMPTVGKNNGISLSAPNSYHLEDSFGWPSSYETVCKGWVTLDDVIYVYKSDGTAIASAYIGNGTEANILEKITVGNVTYKVRNIGYNAFFKADTLERVNIPKGITSIDAHAFQSCARLESIELPDSVISIGEYAFSGCTGLVEMEIPGNVTSMGNYAFSSCSGLQRAVIGSGVTSLSYRLFIGCSELSQIVIGANVRSIANDVFSGCNKLSWIYFDGNPPSPTTAFASAPAEVIYYRAGNNNWPKVWEGFPTEEWVEAPQIIFQPQSQQVIEGDAVTFVVETKGTAPLNYQWYKDEAAIEGATSETYTIESVTTEDLGNYQVVVSNTEGEAVSDVAVLSLLQPPVITVNPVSVTVDNGTNVVFTVEALNADSYQWYKDGTAISGATETIYSIDYVKGSDVGTYTAMAINRAGAEKSSPAALSLTQPYRATAELQMVNGFIVGITVTDCGWGYEFEPKVRIKDEFGEGAEAHCIVEGGMVTAIVLDNPGSGYSEETTVKVGSPFKYVGLKAEVKQIKLTLYLVLGETYQLEACTDINAHDWKRIGEPFIADEEETEIVVEVLETGRYFRVHEVK